MIEEWVRGELNQVNRGGQTTRQVKSNGKENEIEGEIGSSTEVGVNRIEEEDEVVEVEVVKLKVVMRMMEGVAKVVRKESDRSMLTMLLLVKWQMWFYIGRRYGSWEKK